jgi:hypothetical protein
MSTVKQTIALGTKSMEGIAFINWIQRARHNTVDMSDTLLIAPQ